MTVLKLEIGSPAETGIGNCVISPTDDSDGAYFTLIGGGSNEEQNALAAEIVARFNAAAAEISRLQSALEARTEGNPVRWLIEHKSFPDEIALTPSLTDADRAAGFTERPLFAVPPAAAIRKLQEQS